MKNLNIFLLLLFSSSLMAQENWAERENWINLIAPAQINAILEVNGQYYCGTHFGLIIFDPISENIERVSLADGLPYPRIEEVLQDNEGKIWIGTYGDGLVVQEGDSWSRVPFNPTNPEDGNINDPLHCMQFDNNGILWVGSNKGIFTYEEEQWIKHGTNRGWDMAKDAAGNIYVAGHHPAKFSTENTSEYTMYEYSNDSLTCYTPDSRIDVTPDGKIYWANDIGRLAVIDGDEWTVYVEEDFGFPYIPIPSEINFSFNTPQSIKVLPNGEVYAAYFQGRVYKLNEETDQWDKIYQVNTFADIILEQNQAGKLLMGQVEQLYTIDEEINQIADLSTDLPSNNVEMVANELEQILVKSDNRVFQYSVVQNDSNDTELSYTEISPPTNTSSFQGMDFIEFPDKSIGYFESETGKIYYENQVIEVYNPDDLPEDLYAITDLFIDSQGGYWITGVGGILYNFEGIFTYFNHTNTPYEPISEFSDVSIYGKTSEDRNGNIWVASDNGIGRWNKVNQVWDYFNEEASNETSARLYNDHYFDSENILWASGGAGLVRYDGETWSSFTVANSDLPSNNIHDIYPWNDQLLLATSNGISIFDGSNFENYSTLNSGLGNNDCQNIAEDEQGNLWISNKGFSVFLKEENPIDANGLFDNPSQLELSLYPNPSSDFLNIDFRQIQEPVKSLQLINSQGKVVFLQETIQEQSSIPVSHLDQGIYIVKLTSKNSIRTAKVIVQ